MSLKQSHWQGFVPMAPFPWLVLPLEHLMFLWNSPPGISANQGSSQIGDGGSAGNVHNSRDDTSRFSHCHSWDEVTEEDTARDRRSRIPQSHAETLRRIDLVHWQDNLLTEGGGVQKKHKEKRNFKRASVSQCTAALRPGVRKQTEASACLVGKWARHV